MAISSASLRHYTLQAAKSVGVFSTCRAMQEGRLQILCYHGFSIADEHLFRPKLFMQASTFRQRMEWLAEHRYRIVPLDEGLRRLVDGTLEPDSIAITIDDGFRGTASHAAPVLRDMGFPATVYVTSYYVKHANPVFRLAVQYIFWRTRATRFDASAFLEGMEADAPVQGKGGERVMFQLIEHAEAHFSEAERVRLSERLGEVLDVDYEDIVRRGALSIMTPDQLRSLAGSGIDVQLHTHRHRLPLDESSIVKEIEDNRSVLDSIVGGRLTHFCYPSGQWHPSHWDVLQRLGIVSATTCDPGPNKKDAPMLALTRLLDADNMQMLEFEAELCGLKHQLRTLLGREKTMDMQARSHAD